MLLSIGLLLSPPAAAWCAPNPCPIDAGRLIPDEPLEQFAKAVQAGGPVDVLAVGSASTAEGGARAGYPRRAIEALHAALSRVIFRLTVRGGRGLTAPEMVPLIAAALKQRHYPLVLWQTGTVDAVHGLSPDELRDALEAGARLVEANGGDLVLIDPQFSRLLRASVNLDPYEQALALTAELPGIVLFPRFELMESWEESGGIDLESAEPPHQQATAATLQACVGNALARFLLAGIGR